MQQKWKQFSSITTKQDKTLMLTLFHFFFVFITDSSSRIQLTWIFQCNTTSLALLNQTIIYIITISVPAHLFKYHTIYRKFVSIAVWKWYQLQTLHHFKDKKNIRLQEQSVSFNKQNYTYYKLVLLSLSSLRKTTTHIF